MPKPKRGSSGVSALFAIDKPLGLSSHDVVNRVRKVFNEPRVGHTGTLDPLASGVLIVGVGQAARLSDLIVAHNKTYIARICFGEERTTDDREGLLRCTSSVPLECHSAEYAQSICNQFCGDISQVPPEYSAIHVDGGRAYDQARQGKHVILEPRSVTISSALVLSVGSTDENVVYWDVCFNVSKGTYIRSLARDIGRAVGSAAYLGALRRTALGKVDLSDCIALELLEQVEDPLELALSPSSVIDAETCEVSAEQLGDCLNGKALSINARSKYVVASHKGRIYAYLHRMSHDESDPCASLNDCLDSAVKFRPSKVFPAGILDLGAHSSVNDHMEAFSKEAQSLIKDASRALIPVYHDQFLTTRTSDVVFFESFEDVLRSVARGEYVSCMGAFDGVHSGHLYLIGQTISSAKELHCPSAIITFDRDPDELFKDKASVRKLSSNDERIERLAHLGADKVVVLPFTHDLAALTYLEFLDLVTQHLFQLVQLHVGSDFKVGSLQQGTVERLQEWGRRFGCEVYGADLLQGDKTVISSTRIRDLIAQGDMQKVQELLGRLYVVRGTVVTGRQQGRSFGIPTANVELTYPYLLPRMGVYSGIVKLDSRVYPAAINIGVPQTFKSEAHCGYIEAYLLGFSGNAYGKCVSVAFSQKLRDQQIFKSKDELIDVITHNINQVKGQYGSTGFALKGL